MSTEILITVLASLVIGLFFGVVVVFVYQKIGNDKQKNAASKEADRIINRAKSKASKIEHHSKSKAADFEKRARRNAEEEIKKDKKQLKQAEERLKEIESSQEKKHNRSLDKLNEKISKVSQKEEELVYKEERVLELQESAKKEITVLKEKLHTVANMSEDAARKELKQALYADVKNEIAPELNKIEEEARKDMKEKAKRILAVAISRYASEVATERTVKIIALTSDEMKGKLIGREGRNIRALEASCGVDIIIDETPESVVISSFDPIRREVAHRTIAKLMEDGRIHPARIEEVAVRAKKDLMSSIREEGEQACFELEIHGVQSQILNLIGQLKYRHEASQNLFKHSLQVGYVAGAIAAELGSNVQEARRAGLLHGIGRAIDHTVEGSYAKVGADFAAKNGERPLIVGAIRCHNSEVEAVTLLDHIIQASYRFVLSRPGAKRSMIENFIKRLSDLESIANSFDGVRKSYALQSGKEVSVMVDSGKISDIESKSLSRDISKKIERELNFPGQIKVAVIRETRIVEHAR